MLPLRGARPAASVALRAVSGFGVFSVAGGAPRVGWRDGDEVVDLSALGDVFAQPSLNALMALGREAWAEALAARARTTARATRSARRRCTCRSRSPTTSTSTRRSSTRRTWAACSAPTPSRCCRTGAGFRSAITGGRAPSSSAAPTSSGRAASCKGRTERRYTRRPGGSTSSSSSASSSACRAAGRAGAGGAVRGARLRRRARQRLERARHPGVGVPSRSARSSASRSRPPSPPG